MIDHHIEDIVPILHVYNMKKSIEFYQEVMKFQLGFVADDNSFCILKLGSTAIHLVKTDSNNIHPTVSYIWCQDIEALSKTLNQTIDQRPYGMKEFCMNDLDGHSFIFGENTQE